MPCTRTLRQEQGYASRLRSLPTLHRSGIPLRERPFDRGEDSGAMDNECAGICGV
jgi:hypothetical protein